MAIRKPRARRPLPPVQPPPREELPPVTEEVEPERELPPVEPIELPTEPVELYPLIARLYPSFPTLKPEELQTQMAELSSWAQEDPEAFLYDLDVRATPEERDIVLRTLGVPEEYFVTREISREAVEEEEARITELVTTVFPDIETPEELIEFATEDWGLFILSIQEKGRSKETQDLLRLMGFEWEDIGQIFAQERVLMDVEGIRTLVTIDVNERGISLAKDMRGRVIGEIDPITNDVIPYQYRIGDTWEHFTAGVGDVIVTAGGALKWLGADGMGENLSEFGKFLQLQVPPDTLGEFEWSFLLNPRFYATRVTRTIPFTLSLIPAMIAGKYAGLAVALKIGVGNFGTFLLEVLGAVAFSRPLESALEAGGVYDRAIEKGLSEAEARKAASETFVNNLALVGLDAVQLAVAFAPMPARVFTNLITRGLVTTARVGGRLTITGLSEAGEEWYQEIIQRVALGEDVVWDAEMKEVVAIGGIIGVGFGTAGEVWLSIQNKTIDSMPTDARTKFNSDRAGFIEQGFDEKQAALKALDLYAETPEGQEVIRNVIENEKIDAFEKEIKPETEADKIVWEQTFDQMREEITPIPEEILPGGLVEVRQLLEDLTSDTLARRTLIETVGEERVQEIIRETEQQVARLEEARIPEVVPAVPEVPIAEAVIPEATKAQQAEYTRRMRPFLDEANIKIKEANDDFMAGRTSLAENQAQRDAINAELDKQADIIRAEMGFPVAKPPAVEVAKPPVTPEVMAERAITSEQTESLNTLAKEKLIMTEEGKTKPQLRRLMKALTGKNRINQLTNAEADLVIDAVGRLEVKYGRPPVIPTGVGLITAEFADKIPLLKEIGILEKVRPTRHVFEKMGLRQEVWKPAFEAEVRVYEEHQAFDKELNRIGKLVGKDLNRRSLVFRELENPGSQVGLTFDEKRAVTWFRKYFNEWADRLNLPENKRRTNYVTHIFEEEISQQLKEKHPIDPELIKALDFITPKTVFNPYLQKRLGQTIGLREDPLAAATAYEARALKVFYYEPLIQRIRVYQKYLPPRSAKYLGDFINRITDRPSNIDKAMNHTIKEFTDKIRGLPGGEAFANFLTRGNPSGMASYNLTSVLYTLWLGFKPTSAIRNLGQHTLIIAEVGPVNFAKGIALRVTKEGRAALKESLVLRSRRGAFIPAVDSSFASKWTDSFREKALWMFRYADKQNVSDAFLAGYSEAKELFPKAPRELWINRGDEVAADTQYLYTKFNSFSMSQNSIGRVFSMLTTWTENWMELMTKWIKVRPSQVYLAYTKETGQAMPVKNWSQTSKAILMYMLIVGLGYALKEKTRLKAWEYTGLTSLSYLADIAGGDFPALEVPGAVMDVIVGFVTDDERRLKAGLNALQRTLIPSVIKQMDYVASGERDALTLLFYLEGKDIEIKRLKDKWEKEFETYPLFKDDEGVYDPDLKLEYIRTHPKHAGWSDAKIRNQWRIDNPLTEAKMFIVGQFTVLSSDEARAEVLRLIEEHKIDTELIDGYEKVFGVDTEPELQGFQNRLGNLEKFVIGEEAEYFTTSNFATEVNRLVNIQGRSKIERDGNKLAIEYLHATDLWEPYYNFEEDDARTLWRQQYPDVEALLYLFGKVSSFKNPKSAEILLGLMKKYDIPPEAIRAFLDDPARYDELFTQKFELEQKWFDQTTEYENFGNTEAPNYIEDAELRKEARAKFKEDNPNWVADMRRIEAIDNDAPENIMEGWVERGKTIDEFGAGSSEAKLWLLENPETLEWALDKELLSDDLSDENIDLLRLTVDNRGLFEKFNAIDAEAQQERLAFRAEHPDFDKFLIEVKGYSPHSLRETIRVFRETEGDEKFELLGSAVYEYGQLAVKDSLTVEEVFAYTWDIRSFDWKKDTVLPHMVHWGNEFYKLFDWLSREPDAEQLKRITERVPDFEKYMLNVLLPIYQSEPSDKFPLKTWEALLYLTVNSYRDGAEKLIELVGEIGIPNQWDSIKAEIQGIPHNKPDDWPEGVDWYEDDWFFIEHPVFYKSMVETGAMKEKDFSKVPTRAVFDKYLEYVKLPQGKRRDDFRWENQDLDAWLVLKFNMVPIVEKRRRAELTPTEEFLEYVLEKETEFDEAMRELEELLAGLR